MQATDHISPIKTTNPQVFAFRITGQVDDDSMEAMAKFMNTQFDKYDKVNMLIHFDGFEGADWDASLDWDVMKAQFRSNSEVAKYAVVGAPDAAAKMISFFDKLSPVDARTFDVSELAEAWTFVGAQPVLQGA